MRDLRTRQVGGLWFLGGSFSGPFKAAPRDVAAPARIGADHPMAATVRPDALQALAADHGWDTQLTATADGDRVLEAVRGTVELTVLLMSDGDGQYRVAACTRDDRAESAPTTSSPAPAATLLVQAREMVTADLKD